MSIFYSLPANFGEIIPISFPNLSTPLARDREWQRTRNILESICFPVRPIYFPRLESLIEDAIESSNESIEERAVSILNAPHRMTPEEIYASNLALDFSAPWSWIVENILNASPRMCPWEPGCTDNLHMMIGIETESNPPHMMVDDLEEVVAFSAQMRQRMILNFFYGYGMFTDEEAIRRWFEEMGIPWPENMNASLTYLTSHSLIGGAKTLRQRVFAQLFNGFNTETKLITLSHTNISKREIDPVSNTARGLMAACRRDKKIRKELSKLPIASPPAHSNANAELIKPLQDLADIITHEIQLAYTESYYPGVVDVDPLTDEHVEQIMTGMQREIDREQRISPELGEDGKKRMKRTVHLPSLSKERKIALSERRRNWFKVFGITPESWKKGTFSLWKVSNDLFPKDYERGDEPYA
ncbi:hypothetical protein LCGC14_1857940 [marine sediment metagenome]|uniref:Uncharacterized protein n=1 Tax=marine sediment metagenome TaxID=412755 RepID=A0A0F9IMS6_9ZZZZ